MPETVGENVVTIAKKSAKQIYYSQAGFIDFWFRVEKKLNRTEQTKPPPILLKFTTEVSRDGVREDIGTILLDDMNAESLGLSRSQLLGARLLQSWKSS